MTVTVGNCRRSCCDPDDVASRVDTCYLRRAAGPDNGSPRQRRLIRVVHHCLEHRRAAYNQRCRGGKYGNGGDRCGGYSHHGSGGLTPRARGNLSAAHCFTSNDAG